MSQLFRFGSDLVKRFEENLFDLAGFAALPNNDESDQNSLMAVHDWVNTEGDLTESWHLAILLYALLRVAQKDYDGAYFPHLSNRLSDLRKETVCILDQRQQNWLGEQFRTALHRFHYAIPTAKESWVNVSPIICHAGIPTASLKGLLRFMAAHLETFGDQLPNLDGLTIAQLAADPPAYVHLHLRLLLQSQLRGVVNLWSILARTMLAWSTNQQTEEELLQLPTFLDGEVVCEILADLFQSSTTVDSRRNVKATPSPQLRYDPHTGGVYLNLYTGSQSDWRLEPDQNAIVWMDTPSYGLTVAFRHPLGNNLRVSGVGRTREFVTRPRNWLGFWFRAANGLLESGSAIDANGLEAGKWFALLPGKPEGLDESQRRPLDWAFFDEGKEWTAWEVVVPERTGSQTSLTWRISSKSHSINLAFRRGPRISVDSAPVGTAITNDGNLIPVFSKPPIIRNDGDRLIEALLIRITADQKPAAQQHDLSAKCCQPIATFGPGMYRLCERRGLGRILLDFAFIPGLKFGEATTDANSQHVELHIESDSGTGCIDAANAAVTKSHPAESWHLRTATVEPFLKVRWRWAEASASDLTFIWPISGLRWRVLGMDEERAQWTRELIELSASDVAKTDAQFEIQIPVGESLVINGYARPTKPCALGSGIVLGLQSFQGVDLLSVSTDAYGPCDAVWVMERPLLNDLQAEVDENKVLLHWSTPSVISGKAVLLAWDPLDLKSKPVVVTLSDCECQASMWMGDWATLGDASCIAVSLSIRKSVGFFVRDLFAAYRNDPGQPCYAKLERPGRQCPVSDAWLNWFHLLSAGYRSQIGLNADAIRLQLLKIDGAVPWNQLCNAVDELRTQSHTRQLAETVSELLQARASDIVSSVEMNTEQFAFWLDAGIHLGWPATTRDAITKEGSQCGYPFAYFLDLLMLRAPEAGVDSPATDDLARQRREAGRNVSQFHRDYDLPDPWLGLPLHRGEAHIPLHLGKPPLPVYWTEREPSNEEKKLPKKFFLKDLGLGDDDVWLYVGEQKTDPHKWASRPYRLIWSHPDQSWFVEQLKQRNLLVRKLNRFPAPMSVARWSPQALGEHLDIRTHLARWANKETNPFIADPAGNVRIDSFLFQDQLSGDLHRWVLVPPREVSHSLDASKFQIVTSQKEIVLFSAKVIPALGLWAWRIAWIDRLAARRGDKTLFGPGAPLAGERAAHLKCLARGLRMWPELMRCCLALVEYLYWVLYDRGLGVLASYVDNRSEVSKPSIPRHQ